MRGFVFTVCPLVRGRDASAAVAGRPTGVPAAPGFLVLFAFSHQEPQEDAGDAEVMLRRACGA